MHPKLAKFSNIIDPDLSSSKFRVEGLWCLQSLFKASGELVKLSKTNFTLQTNPRSFVLHEDLECLIDLLDKVLSLDVSTITPPNAFELLDHTEKFQVKILDLLSNPKSSTFESDAGLAAVLFPIVDTIGVACRELYEQSRHNIIQTLDNQEVQFEQDQLIGLIKQKLQKMQNFSEAEFKANLCTFVYDILKYSSQLEKTSGSRLSTSLSYQV